ncbi:ComEC/Rec2 family competence protein [Arcobacter sp. FWKO B]|uniref:ComEC/Rec2 family competence protein n=1 Tax=Arcobacter sp. FWKO B TaxID=2593672 RepID=UPI0018A55534|nr:ComEC/Rec2 family competence protein [Arcobacter sp. FWKO B]QOG13191.1 ComEC/Rec2 family competence protein [Arcobacter sp. FWKO B]
MLESQHLLNSRLQWLYLIIILGIIFSINIFIKYQNYLEFKKEILYDTKATVINIYPKQNHNIIRLKTQNFEVFTSTKETLLQNDNIKITLITDDISFLDFLRGFLTKSFGIEQLPSNNSFSLSNYLSQKISSQHDNTTITMIYQALYLATPPTKELREFFNGYGISHLIAISGFHLGVLSVIFYFMFNLVYKPLHQKYLPYRNKKYDILLITIFLLFGYLILIDLVASFLRSFVMFVFGVILLRSNIKILSFETLLLTVLFILAFFSEYILSISLWFSIAGVFYIFLFLHNYQNINKYLLFFLFNFWIYLAVNPITQYFFGTVSLYQLLSPFFSLIFTAFYPISLALHFIELGWIFDSFLVAWLDFKIPTIELFASIYFVLPYIVVSIMSIWSKIALRITEISFIGFNLWLFGTIIR